MFKVIVLVCCILAVKSQALHDQLIHLEQHATPYRSPSDEPPRPYEFAYETELEGGRMGRKESGDASGRVVGSYSLSEDDGRSRVVEYVADADGFRANVKTNEPGTKSENPADVTFYSTAPEVAHAHGIRPATRHTPAVASHHAPIVYAAHGAAPQRYYIRHPTYYGRIYH